MPREDCERIPLGDKGGPLTDGDQSSIVVPAYPYEGALYWMFEETRSNPIRQLSLPYYAQLYGQKSSERAFRSQAAAAVCLFDLVMLAGADSFIPNGLAPARVTVAEDDNLAWRDHRKEIIAAISNLKIVNKFRKRHATTISDESNFELFADRAILQLGVAEAHGATILGGKIFADFCAVLEESAFQLGSPISDLPALQLRNAINPEHFDVYGINFSPPDFDAFTSVRADDMTREYGRRFCHALLNVTNPIEREREFVTAIRAALGSVDI